MGQYERERLKELQADRRDRIADIKSVNAQIKRLHELLNNSTRGNPGIPRWKAEIQNLKFQRDSIDAGIKELDRRIADLKRQLGWT